MIRADGLTHRFGALTAVDGVDLSVAAGEIYGFLGRNGAGKTTVIRALLGLLSPTSGEVRLLGRLVEGGRTRPELWAGVGYLVEGPGLYPALTVLDHLRLAALYRGLSRSVTDEVIERLDLGSYAHVRAGVLSLGNRQRLGLALALAHRPRVVILDEPSNGLDPAGVVDVRHLLRSLADDGVTVFMSSHIISEVSKVADRVGIIHSGRLVTELSGERLTSPGHQRLVATFRTTDLAQRGLTVLRSWGADGLVDGNSVTSTAAKAIHDPDQVATQLVRAGAPPAYLAVEREDLEQLFLRLTEHLTAPVGAE